jgi:hypothetical protein
MHLDIIRGENGEVSLEKRSAVESSKVAKANALASNDKWLILGGLTPEGKGVVEVWSIRE